MSDATDKKPEAQFLRACKAMMDALDVAEGMRAYELECFAFNFSHFIGDMVHGAHDRELKMKYPMRRHDYGKDEA